MGSNFKKEIKIFFILVFLINSTLWAEQGYFYLYEPDRKDGKTASGETFNSEGLTCAHSSYPFGTKIGVMYGDDGLVNIEVNDRIDSDDSFFAVSPQVLSKLFALDENCIKAIYSVRDEGSGADSWGDGGKKNQKWCNISNIKHKNLFDLYENLLSLGYKSRYENNSLTILFVQSRDVEYILGKLKDLGADTDSFEIKFLDQNPLRQ